MGAHAAPLRHTGRNKLNSRAGDPALGYYSFIGLIFQISSAYSWIVRSEEK